MVCNCKKDINREETARKKLKVTMQKRTISVSSEKHIVLWYGPKMNRCFLGKNQENLLDKHATIAIIEVKFPESYFFKHANG